MGIFDDQVNLYTRYRARLQFRDRLMGGTPKNPKMIEGWLRSKAGIDQQEELRQAMARTMIELGHDVQPGATFDEMVAASEKLASTKQTVGFKVEDEAPYIEARQVKAMLKESTNILFAGDKWTGTNKGPRNVVAERVFILPERISLGVPSIGGVEAIVGHITGPQGPRATLTYHEYVERPVVEFDVLIAESKSARAYWRKLPSREDEAKLEGDMLTDDQWALIWVHAQENGLGALRSQGYGRFDIEAWDLVAAASKIREVA